MAEQGRKFENAAGIDWGELEAYLREGGWEIKCLIAVHPESRSIAELDGALLRDRLALAFVFKVALPDGIRHAKECRAAYPAGNSETIH